MSAASIHYCFLCHGLNNLMPSCTNCPPNRVIWGHKKCFGMAIQFRSSSNRCPSCGTEVCITQNRVDKVTILIHIGLWFVFLVSFGWFIFSIVLFTGNIELTPPPALLGMFFGSIVLLGLSGFMILYLCGCFVHFNNVWEEDDEEENNNDVFVIPSEWIVSSQTQIVPRPL